MQRPGTPTNEEERLRDLDSYGVLDTAADPFLDSLTRLAVDLLKVPIALVSLVDLSRQWFKSRRGLDTTETARDFSFCAHAVTHGSELIVCDTLTDPRFVDNPLVTGAPGIRFYAGVPLRNSNGHTLGTFCVIDRQPRELSASEHGQLTQLAGLAMLQLESIRKLNIMHRVVDAVPGMLAYWDRNERCQFANAAYEQWFGVRPEALLGRTLSDLLGPIYALNLPYIEGALRGEEQLFDREIPDPRGGPARYSQAHYIPHVSQQGVHGFAVMVADITARRRLETDLEQARAHAESLARHDALTGLPNRAEVEARLGRIQAHAERHGRQFAVMFLDLDGFKNVNDSLGHAAGDLVLREVAQRLLAVTRKSDTVGRLGGDEFIVILPEINEQVQAETVAEKLRSAIEAPAILVDGRPSGITLSIGVVIFPCAGPTTATLLDAADSALYQAKRSGRNRVMLYEPASDEGAPACRTTPA